MRRRGLTLIEIMVVFSIIALLVAIAVPNLIRARLNTNEISALNALRTINTSVESYKFSNSTYPLDLLSMGPGNATPPYIDSVLAGGSKSGYNFVLTGSAYTFTATAIPQAFGTTGNKSFYVDESATIGCTPSSGSTLE